MANIEHLNILALGVDVWNTWREDNPDINPDLRKADLARMNLPNINLSGAKLGGSNLTEANLSKSQIRFSQFGGANLTGANLTNANIFRSNFNDAIFNSALFHETNLNRVNLIGAKFNSADFYHAYVIGAIFDNNNLSEAMGLDTVRYHGPSTIGHRTLALSKKLPIEFMRGCGLSDWEIEIVNLYRSNLTVSDFTEILYNIQNLLFDSMISYYSCFISYSHADKTFAQNIFNDLQNRGIRCWLDEHQILPGDDIRDQIDRGINLWDKVLLCCSESSLNSYWVSDEIDRALKKEEQIWRERGEKVLALIPLNLDGYMFKWENSRATDLIKRHAEDFVNWEKDWPELEHAIERVGNALRADLGARELPPEPKL